MKSKNNPPYQIQLSAIHSLLVFSIIFVLCQHGSAGANLSNQTDRSALLEFKRKISNDPLGFFSSWNDSIHICQWRGVECGLKHQRVTGLNISSQNILGTITPHIGNLSFLSFINLENNSFHGEIPQQIGRLFRLRNLYLNNNSLVGYLPANLSRCLHLSDLFLSYNRLVGPIPEELGSLKNLDSLILESNHLSGFIPRSLGNLSSLTYFSVGENNIEGIIPNELGRLSKLTFFNIQINNISGTIPSSLYNISTITVFSVLGNHLTGTIPLNIGLTLPNLEEIYLGGNNFQGEILHSFSNSSQLLVISIEDNKFSGQVPSIFGFLQNLQSLYIWGNSFGSNATNDLSFITSLSNCSYLQELLLNLNNFGGEIPNSIGNLSVELIFLALSGNYITGTIPSVLENLVNLSGLWLDNNLLSGSIPSSIGKLVNLQELVLYGNILGGRIPSSLGNISWLNGLDLSDNKLEGNIPESISNCEKLSRLDLSQNRLNGSIPKNVIGIFSLSIVLNLSRNSLTGKLPTEVGKLKNINILDISNNELSGNIPATIGECLSLEYLDIHGNFFQGIIPSALAALRGIRVLDLSGNNLSGEIPKAMEKLPYLQYLNLSFNELEGEVSKAGVFGNASVVSVYGNSKLCGGINGLKLPPCRIRTRKQRVALVWKIVIIASVGVLVLVSVSIISIIFLRRKTKKGPTTTADLMVENLLRISYHDLFQATDGFSPRNLIGSGSFGSVYQGKLNQEDKLVAVKVLKLEKSGASKSFTAECRALRNIRHRNLVKIKTYCSSIDSKRNPFKALVYEFMPNGSLDMWLHPQVQERLGNLDVLQKLNIAIDVANAIHYLHDLCEPSIIHCDLKPSNVLLDNELIAHVGDFGLARLVSKSVDTFAQTQSSSMGLMGSMGYAAPEYGVGGEASKNGDVYSYGVLILELITGKRPTDEMFKDDLNLHMYVRMALEQNDVMKIVDPTLVETGENSTEAATEEEDIVVEQHKRKKVNLASERYKLEKCIIEVTEIGIGCSTESPKERMGMNDVVRELQRIRVSFLDD